MKIKFKKLHIFFFLVLSPFIIKADEPSAILQIFSFVQNETLVRGPLSFTVKCLVKPRLPSDKGKLFKESFSIDCKKNPCEFDRKAWGYYPIKSCDMNVEVNKKKFIVKDFLGAASNSKQSCLPFKGKCKSGNCNEFGKYDYKCETKIDLSEKK